MKSQMWRALAGVFVSGVLLTGGAAFGAQAKPADAKAIFAGGCFWCMEASFEFLKKKTGGISDVVSGYTGGTKENPTYKEVSAGGTGHREAIQVTYDPSKITYERLLEAFWSNIDPEDSEGQFCDKGEQYTSAIFYVDDSQKKAAEKSLKEYAKKMKVKAKVATAILPAKTFYPAEDYHQDFSMKSQDRYESYKSGCGRDARLKEVWGTSAH
jgi:peptide-methionine (S)-S-oxide reductase